MNKWIRLIVTCAGVLTPVLVACPGPNPPPAGTAPTITSLAAERTDITAGESTTLFWTVTGTGPINLSIDNGVGDVTGESSVEVTPTETTSYTLTAESEYGSATGQVVVTVDAPPAGTAPTIASFTAAPSSINEGESATLSWSLTGSSPITLSIDPGVGDVTGESSVVVMPGETTTYTLTASNSNGSVSDQVTVAVRSGTAPTIYSFTAEPTRISAGEGTTLGWAVLGTSPITLGIDNGVGDVSGQRSVDVTPGETTTYTLIASNSWGTASEQLTVTVNAPPIDDNSKLAFVSYRDGNSEIYRMKADGSEPTNLTNYGGADFAPAWSPDGSKIAFVSYRTGDGSYGIYLMNADGSLPTRLADNAESHSNPTFSPDGSKIAFVSNRDGNSEIYVMNADGSGQTNLSSNSASDVSPAWSPDGSKIAFLSNRDGNGEIYVMNVDGSGIANLTNNVWSEGEPAWSPDGSRIAFVRLWSGNEIYVMNSDGSLQTRLTDNTEDDNDPTWSPDGSRIAYTSQIDGNREIYVMNADGTGQTNLSNNMAGDTDPAWTP